MPPALAEHRLALADGGRELVYTYDTQGEHTGITTLLDEVARRRTAFQGPFDDAKARSRTFSSAW